MGNNKFLSLDIVMSLLYHKFGNCKKIDKRSIYKSEDGEIFAIASSKEYENGELWVSYDINRLRQLGINYLVIIAAFYGVIVLPVDILFHYQQYSNKVKGGRDNIRIKFRINKFFLFSKRCYESIDITNYFIENEMELDYLQDYNRSKILLDAISFEDYKEQYVEGGLTRIRHESKVQKERIAILENYTCQICGFHQSYLNKNGKKRWIIEVDHIIEKSRGGGERIDNLLVLCANCHAKKTYGIITIGKDLKVYEQGVEIPINDHHLRLK